jgi:hypothetical protein
VLSRSANTVTSQAQSIRSLADDANFSHKLPITEICSLRGGITKLANNTIGLQSTIDALNDAAEHSVVLHLRSLGSQSPPIAFRILSHFDKQIKDIVREVLDNISDQDVLWKVAEECFKQTVSPYGTLDAEDYFSPLEEAFLGWPFDINFESEEYYDHENRLDVDEDYATVFQDRELQRSEARCKDRQSWPAFWVQVLNNAPSGPTLFHPRAGFGILTLDSDVTPRYLFAYSTRPAQGETMKA